MTSSRLVHRFALIVGLAGAASGCDPSPTYRSEAPTQAVLALEEVGNFLRMHKKGGKPAPKSIKDLAPMENGFPQAYMGLQAGAVVVYWGVDFDPTDSKTVVAYEKTAPESGGEVLMRDGSTVKMTAEEFKAAPKPAEGKLSTEVDAKSAKKTASKK
ncbi:MAG: hypothetical protein P4L85_25655 [Paludisphaera borealis]|uniref:hypothetical protein n=1 Tax=Paludisphaera borealis TaxID=1387353 RepID=UPI00283F530D|nr:hypothetical protein [Paludisphaera borealis]MDR3622765.1 hypothetical protein [Paludisphaera borealis]